MISDLVGVDANWRAALNATEPGKFRFLLEAHNSTRRIFKATSAHLAAQGPTMRDKTCVDLTPIAARPLTNNQDKQRDPATRQSTKPYDRHSGMNACVAADAAFTAARKLVGTAGNAADVAQAHALLQGEETVVFADANYLGVKKHWEPRACGAVACGYGTRTARNAAIH